MDVTTPTADKPAATNQYSRSRRKCACGEPALAGAYKCLTCVEQQAALRETALALLESGREKVNISYAVSECPVCRKRGCVACQTRRSA